MILIFLDNIVDALNRWDNGSISEFIIQEFKAFPMRSTNYTTVLEKWVLKAANATNFNYHCPNTKTIVKPNRKVSFRN
jgi:hypothetical protein